MNSAHKSNWAIAEVIFGVPFLAGVVLHLRMPFLFSPGIVRQILLTAGIFLISISATLIIMARREFARYLQPTDPGQPTSRLITTGPFSISRNPLYLASIILFSGISLATGMPWTLVTLLISIVLCHFILILPEEKYLTEKFGDEYLIYASTVHRWLGKK